MLFEKSDIPHKFRRQPVPAALWGSMLGCLVITMVVPGTTLLGTIVVGLGRLGLGVCMAIFVHHFPPRSLPTSAAMFMWVLVLIMALTLSYSAYWFWQADQFRAHLS